MKSSIRLWLRGRAPRKEVNKIFKHGMKVDRTFKSKRVTDPTRILMMLEVMLEFLRIFELSSLAVFEAVRGAGGGRHEITEVRV